MGHLPPSLLQGQVVWLLPQLSLGIKEIRAQDAQAQVEAEMQKEGRGGMLPLEGSGEDKVGPPRREQGMGNNLGCGA